MTKMEQVFLAFLVGCLLIIAGTIFYVVSNQHTPIHTQVERNSQGQRLDFDRCATILQWTEECLP